jgi:hypothetical protein
LVRRLYLDTADLIEIGDDRVEPDAMSGLLRAMEESGTMLTVSKDHVQDITRAPSDGRRARPRD